MSRHIRYGYTESSPDGGYIYRTVHHRPVHHPPRSRDSGRDRYSLSSYNSSYLSYDNSRRYYTLSAAHNACMRTAAGLRPVTVYFADAPRGRGRGRGRGSYFPPPRDRYDQSFYAGSEYSDDPPPCGCYSPPPRDRYDQSSYAGSEYSDDPPPCGCYSPPPRDRYDQSSYAGSEYSDDPPPCGCYSPPPRDRYDQSSYAGSEYSDDPPPCGCYSPPPRDRYDQSSYAGSEYSDDPPPRGRYRPPPSYDDRSHRADQNHAHARGAQRANWADAYAAVIAQRGDGGRLAELIQRRAAAAGGNGRGGGTAGGTYQTAAAYRSGNPASESGSDDESLCDEIDY